MRFSFIVPVYNNEKYITDCVESLLAQEVQDFEILLIDDGSTDTSGEICDGYKKRYPSIVRVIHKENEGPLFTRRRGFREAKGDWLICVDSDDYVDKNLLSKVGQVIDEYNCDMVMYNFDYVDSKGVHTFSRLNIPDKTVYAGDEKQKIYERRLLTVDVNSMCMRAIRRDILDIDADYSGYGIRNMCDDALQVLAVYSNAKKIVYIAKPLYHYRKGQPSITKIVTYENWKAIQSCEKIAETYLDKWGVSKTVKTKFYTLACESTVNFIRWLVDEEDRELLGQEIEKIRTSPGFKRYCKNYKKKYFSTKYMRICVPIIMKLVKMKNISAILMFIKFERSFLELRKWR